MSAVHEALVPLLHALEKGPLTPPVEAAWAAKLERHEARRRMADDLAAVIGKLMRGLPAAERGPYVEPLCRLLYACLGSARAVEKALASIEGAEDAARALKGAPRVRGAGLAKPTGGAGLRPKGRR